MHYVGLDVHARRSSLCILDSFGKVVKRVEVRGSWPKLMEQVAAQVPRPFAVCFEASCGYGYLHERLSALARRVAVAHPGKLRLIFRSKRKNDRVDAEKQAAAGLRPPPSCCTWTRCPRCTCRRRTCGRGAG